MRLIRLLALVASLFVFAGCEQTTADPIVVSDAWVRAIPPGGEMTAAYARIRNNADGAIRLVGASSPNFGRVELHETTMDDGVSKMRPVDGFKIDASATLSLEAGGRHFMLRFARDLDSVGQSIPMSLAFRDAAGELVSLDMDFPIRKSAP